jgi:hypothetical protein
MIRLPISLDFDFAAPLVVLADESPSLGEIELLSLSAFSLTLIIARCRVRADQLHKKMQSLLPNLDGSVTD